MPKKKKKGKVSYGDNIYSIRGTLWLIFMHKGKIYRHRIGRESEIPLSAARRIAAKLKAEIIENRYIETVEAPAFSAVADEYYKNYSVRANVSEKSKKEIRRKVKMLIKFFKNKTIDKLTELDIQDYKRKRLETVKPQTLDSELRILKAILNFAKKHYNVEVPTVRLLKADEERTTYLTPDELRKLIDACPPWFKPVVKFAASTGLRASELFSLRWEDVNINEGYIIIRSAYSKNNETSYIPVHSEALNALKEASEYQKSKGITSDYVFVNSRGKPYKYEDRTYLRVFKTALRKAGLKNVRFHDLRHTFASLSVMQGLDLYTVQHLLRHKTQKMTQRYSHLSPEFLRKELAKVRIF